MISISRGDWMYYGAVIASALFVILSIATESFIITNILSSMFVMHIGDFWNSLYLEGMLGTMGITAVQIYRYHSNSMDMYDTINIKDASWGRRRIHGTLQFMLALLTFISCQIIFFTVFTELCKKEILANYNIYIEKIFDTYLFWIDLKWLLVYFVIMDIMLAFINWNYRLTGKCDDETKKRLAAEFSNIMWDIPGTLLALSVEFLLIFSMVSYSQEPFVDHHRGAGMIEAIPVFFILAVQVFYVAMDIRRRIGHMPPLAG